MFRWFKAKARRLSRRRIRGRGRGLTGPPVPLGEDEGDLLEALVGSQIGGVGVRHGGVAPCSGPRRPALCAQPTVWLGSMGAAGAALYP